jgi:hypothetical protein
MINKDDGFRASASIGALLCLIAAVGGTGQLPKRRTSSGCGHQRHGLIDPFGK